MNNHFNVNVLMQRFSLWLVLLSQSEFLMFHPHEGVNSSCIENHVSLQAKSPSWRQGFEVTFALSNLRPSNGHLDVHCKPTISGQSQSPLQNIELECGHICSLVEEHNSQTLSDSELYDTKLAKPKFSNCTLSKSKRQNSRLLNAILGLNWKPFQILNYQIPSFENQNFQIVRFQNQNFRILDF